jgi:hypothetical protein
MFDISSGPYASCFSTTAASPFPTLNTRSQPIHVNAGNSENEIIFRSYIYKIRDHDLLSAACAQTRFPGCPKPLTVANTSEMTYRGREVRLERISEKAVERMLLQMTRIVLAVVACFGKNTMVCADSTADVRWCMRMSSASTLSRVSDKS